MTSRDEKSECFQGSTQSLATTYWTRTYVQYGLIILLGLLARLPAVQGEFLWDDQALVVRNPLIRSPLLIGEAFRHYLFYGAYNGHYRPVQTVSYILDYLLWNQNAFGYHLVNIFWHIASGVLLFLLLRRILPGLAPAFDRKYLDLAGFLIALAWVVHPVHSPAIDYISGRADSLSFFFAVGGWLLYLVTKESSCRAFRWVSYSLAAATLLLSLCSRESGLIWLAIFLFHLFAFERERTNIEKFTTAIASLLVVAVYIGLRFLPVTRADTATLPDWSLLRRIGLMFRALGDYGRLMIWPGNLHVERTVFDPRVSLGILALCGFALLIVIVSGALWKKPARSMRLFGGGWFLISYFPVSNIVSLNATVAEHWLYLPSVGLLIFVAGVVLAVPMRCQKLLVGIACFAIVAFTARSFVRSSDWRDPETFFRRTFAAGGTNSRIGVNLGLIYAERGEQAKAEAVLRKVLEVSPGYQLARNNLALALAAQGKNEEAEQQFELASSNVQANHDGNPKTWDASLQLAQLRAQAHDTSYALAILAQARAEYPGTWALVNLEAKIRYATEGPTVALGIVRNFCEKNWWHYEAAVALGRLSEELDRNEEAKAAFTRASRLDVHDAEALNLLAALQEKENHLADACTTQRRALKRAPDRPKELFLLARLLRKTGHEDEWSKALAEINRLQAGVERD